MKTILLCGLLACFASALHAQTTEWVYHKTADGLHPDGNEQQMLWLLNRARANPTAEGLFLADTGDADVNSGITFYNVNVNQMKSEFAALPVNPPAAFDRRIYEGSRAHSLDLIARDAQDHTGQFQRVTDAGFSFLGISGSVYAYSRSAMHAHGALNVDWGPGTPDGMQTGRGHRAAIMGNAPNVGFALVPDTSPGTQVGPLVFSGSYAQANTGAANHFNRFLVGTVWTDTNNNNRYDPGEGMNNVRIQPNTGSWHAITGAGGGWAIPASAGNFTLTISGGALASAETRTVTVGAVSAMVDLKISITPASAMLLTVSRAAGGTLLLTWTGGTAPFQVQSSTTLANGSWQNVGGATNNRSQTVTPGSRTFYRVTGSP